LGTLSGKDFKLDTLNWKIELNELNSLKYRIALSLQLAAGFGAASQCEGTWTKHWLVKELKK